MQLCRFKSVNQPKDNYDGFGEVRFHLTEQQVLRNLRTWCPTNDHYQAREKEHC